MTKLIEHIETVDGEVVDDAPKSGGFFADMWAFFFASGSKPYNDNGREYNSASGNWEYTADRNGGGNQYEVNYDADNNGYWDGVS